MQEMCWEVLPEARAYRVVSIAGVVAVGNWRLPMSHIKASPAAAMADIILRVFVIHYKLTFVVSNHRRNVGSATECFNAIRL